MMNAKAIFDKISGMVKFEKLKWKVPISALIRVKIEKDKDKFNVKLYSDKDKQNEALLNLGEKMIKKTERKFQFTDITPCRDFIYHLKRIYHLHNCCLDNSKNPPLHVDAPPFADEIKK